MNKELKKRLLSSLVMIPTALFFILKGSIFFTFFLFIIFIATSYEWISISKKIILMKFTGIIFLILSFFLAYKLRINEGAYVFIFSNEIRYLFPIIVIVCLIGYGNLFNLINSKYEKNFRK